MGGHVGGDWPNRTPAGAALTRTGTRRFTSCCLGPGESPHRGPRVGSQPPITALSAEVFVPYSLRKGGLNNSSLSRETRKTNCPFYCKFTHTHVHSHTLHTQSSHTLTLVHTPLEGSPVVRTFHELTETRHVQFCRLTFSCTRLP